MTRGWDKGRGIVKCVPQSIVVAAEAQGSLGPKVRRTGRLLASSKQGKELLKAKEMLKWHFG